MGFRLKFIQRGIDSSRGKSKAVKVRNESQNSLYSYVANEKVTQQKNISEEYQKIYSYYQSKIANLKVLNQELLTAIANNTSVFEAISDLNNIDNLLPIINSADDDAICALLQLKPLHYFCLITDYSTLTVVESLLSTLMSFTNEELIESCVFDKIDDLSPLHFLLNNVLKYREDNDEQKRRIITLCAKFIIRLKISANDSVKFINKIDFVNKFYSEIVFITFEQNDSLLSQHDILNNSIKELEECLSKIHASEANDIVELDKQLQTMLDNGLIAVENNYRELKKSLEHKFNKAFFTAIGTAALTAGITTSALGASAAKSISAKAGIGMKASTAFVASSVGTGVQAAAGNVSKGHIVKSLVKGFATNYLQADLLEKSGLDGDSLSLSENVAKGTIKGSATFATNVVFEKNFQLRDGLADVGSNILGSAFSHHFDNAFLTAYTTSCARSAIQGKHHSEIFTDGLISGIQSLVHDFVKSTIEDYQHQQLIDEYNQKVKDARKNNHHFHLSLIKAFQHTLKSLLEKEYNLSSDKADTDSNNIVSAILQYGEGDFEEGLKRLSYTSENGVQPVVNVQGLRILVANGIRLSLRFYRNHLNNQKIQSQEEFEGLPPFPIIETNPADNLVPGTNIDEVVDSSIPPYNAVEQNLKGNILSGGNPVEVKIEDIILPGHDYTITQSDVQLIVTAVNLLEVDLYKELNKKADAGDGMQHDHIPSVGAIWNSIEQNQNENFLKDGAITKNKLGLILPAIVVTDEMHRKGRTYGGKNKKFLLLDSMDLMRAFDEDITTFISNCRENGWYKKYNFTEQEVENAANKMLEFHKKLKIF